MPPSFLISHLTSSNDSCLPLYKNEMKDWNQTSTPMPYCLLQGRHHTWCYRRKKIVFALKGTPLLGHFHLRFCDKHSHKESPWCSHKTVRKCKADLSDSPRRCVCLFLAHVRDLAFAITVFLNPWADEGILWVPVWSVWAKSENLPWKY